MPAVHVDTPGKLVLGCIREQAEQAMREQVSKQHSSVASALVSGRGRLFVPGCPDNKIITQKLY